MWLDSVRQLHRDKPLAGRRIAILATDGFEMVELAVPKAAMRLDGATVDVISIHPGRIRGMNLHEPASTVGVDLTLDEADPGEYDGLLIPGGFVNPDLLRQSAKARAFVRDFGASGKPIASLCHGPWMLASAGLLKGRRLTSWPGLRDDLINAGATWLNEALVRDGNLVTSRGPQDLKPFLTAIVRLFSGAKRELDREFPSSRATRSAPPPDEPPQLVLDVMRWMPKPSVRTIAGLAIAGVAAFLYFRGQQGGARSQSSTPWHSRQSSPGRFALSR
jgi:protease I